MSDKFRITFPIPVTLANGEQPTAAKINAISTQAKNGLALVERAIGDVWTQSGDADMGAEPLQIAGLARIVGQQLYSNPLFQKPHLEVAETVRVNQVVSGQEGQTELYLDFIPEEGAASTLDTELAAAGYTNRRTVRDGIVDDADYFVDTTNRIIYLGSAFPVLANLEYDVLAANWPTDGSSEGAFNVIPDPEMEDDWRGLKFVKRDTNKYFVYLPARRPLKLGASELGRIPRATDNSVLPAASPVHRYWYVDSSNWTSPVDITADAASLAIATAKRYRYKLPEILYDLVTAGSLGAELPSGTIYLWDNTQNTIIEGLTFKVPEVDIAYTGGLRPGWVIQAEGSVLDSLLSGLDSTGITDDPGDYAQRFSLITVGQGLAQKARALATELVSNDPSGFQKKISHAALLDLNPVSRDAGDNSYVAFPAAYRPGDDHPHLLSRDGSTSAGTANERDRYNNGMRGDLLFLSTGSTSNFQNLTSASNAIRFGSMSGPALKFDPDATFTLYDALGGTVSTSNVLLLEGYGLALQNNTLWFSDPGDSDAGAVVYDSAAGHFAFLKRSGTTMDAGLTYLRAGGVSLVNSEDYADIAHAGSADITINADSGGAHSINWRNEDLGIFSLTGQHLLLGLNSFGHSHVYFAANRIYFNEAEADQGLAESDVFSSDSYLVYDGTTGILELRKDEAVSGSTISAGTVSAGDYTITGSNTGTAYCPLHPVYSKDDGSLSFGSPVDGVWKYQDSLFSPGTAQYFNFTWITVGAQNEDELVHLPLPYLPDNVTITQLSLKLACANQAQAANYTVELGVVTESGTSSLTATSSFDGDVPGTDGSVRTHTANLSHDTDSGVNGRPYAISVGITTTGTMTMQTDVLWLKVRYTYNEIRL